MIEQEQELFILNENGPHKNEGGPSAKKTALILIIVAAAVCIVLFFLTSVFFETKQDPDLFADGVSVLGCDLSGKEFAAGEEIVRNEAEEKIAAAQVIYQIDGKDYVITGEQAGLTIQYEQALQQAFAYGKSGDHAADRGALEDARTTGTAFECQRNVESEMIASAVEQNIQSEAENDGAGRIKTVSDEATKTTGYIVEETEETRSAAVDVQKLCEEIANAFIHSENGPISAEILSESGSGQAIEVINRYQTNIMHPELDSAYNIWKASSMINGTEIKPDETWSMLDTLGMLENEAGWKEANELIDGKMERVPGGGLNHLASTIYAAALASELDVEEHAQRPWPADYIEPGLDADIFSENADLKIRNTTDQSIYLMIECAAEENTLTVSFLGKPFDDGAKRELNSEIIEENNEKGGITVRVSLQKKNASGSVEESDELFNVEYRAQAA